MEVLATPAPPRPQRSLSYNDLKRRRLQDLPAIKWPYKLAEILLKRNDAIWQNKSL